MTRPQPSVATLSLDAWTEARQSEARLERLRVQADKVREAVGTLHALLTEEISSQQRAIAARSETLEAQVRADYAVLCERLDSVKSAYDALATGLDESVRRHAEREIDSAAFERMRRTSEDGLRERASELAALDELRARFLAVLEQEPAGEIRTPAPRRDHPSQQVIVPVPAAVPSATFATMLVPASPPAGPVQVVITPPSQAAPPSIVVTERPAPASGTSEAQAVLVEAHEASSGAAHPVSDRLHIGRAIENDLRVLDPSVSRQHALLAVDGGTFVIQDLRSQNGTFVNGERIGQRVLCDGDRISIGEAEFVFRTSREAEAPPRPDAGETEMKSSAQAS